MAKRNFFGQRKSSPTGISRTPLADHRITTEVFLARVIRGYLRFWRNLRTAQQNGPDHRRQRGRGIGRRYSPVLQVHPVLGAPSGGWGAFLNHSARSTAWIGSRCVTHLQIAVDEPWLDMFVFVGSIPTVLAAYTELTGTPQMPPDWSFGFWQSKISYSSATEAVEVAARMRAEDLPFDVLHLDTFWFDRDWYCDLEFSHERFPIRPNFWRNLPKWVSRCPYGSCRTFLRGPRTSRSSPQQTDSCAARTVRSMTSGSVTRQTGKAERSAASISPIRSHVKFIEIESRNCSIWGPRDKGGFRRAGTLDGVYYDGTPGHRAHNLYPLLYHQTLADITMERKGDSIMWARSAYAGSQRYPLHWGGDSSVRWDNLLANVSGGLSLGLSGFAFWSMDIGGFAGVPDDEIYPVAPSWTLSQSLPHPRIWKSGLYDRGETTGTARRLLHLRYQLMPYLLARPGGPWPVECHWPELSSSIISMTRLPGQSGISGCWGTICWLHQSPTELVVVVSTYLKARGDWFTGEAFSGPRWIEVQSPLEIFPLYRAGRFHHPLGPFNATCRSSADRSVATSCRW